MIMVNNGERVFKIPAIELGIRVWPVANKNDGMKIPTRPEIKSFRKSPDFRFLNLVTAIGKRKRNAAVTRMEPT
jgi:hypothetical protein